MNYRKERSFLLGVIEGILFLSQKREYPLTFTNFKPKLHFCADLSAKRALNLQRFENFELKLHFEADLSAEPIKTRMVL